MPGLPLYTTATLASRLHAALPGDVVDLRQQDLREVDFTDRELRTAFAYIQSYYANAESGRGIFIDFTDSILSGCQFTGMDLRFCIFSHAFARHAQFADCDLSDVAMDYAKLDHADLRYARLDYTKLHHASIVGVNFSGADLRNTYGLNMRGSLGDVCERLCVVSSIQNAALPSYLEGLREPIEGSIRANNGRIKSPIIRKVEFA